MFSFLKMLNPSAIGNDAYEFLGGNISDFYADVDDAITMSECVKGQYRLNVQPAVNANDNIITPNFATVNISAPGSLVVDLSNSYISLTAKITLKCSTKRDLTATTTDVDYYYFVGWKSSFEAIRQYEILVNGNTVYTQSFSPIESFIQDQIVTELVRHNSQFMYSSWDNVMHLNPDICGIYIKFNNVKSLGQAYVAGDPITVEIPIKIPIERFLILKNLKYLLSWMGKWELRCFFDQGALVVMPIVPKYILESHFPTANYVVPATVSQDFTQLGDPFSGIATAIVA
jgi:hypothetical protein